MLFSIVLHMFTSKTHQVFIHLGYELHGSNATSSTIITIRYTFDTMSFFFFLNSYSWFILFYFVEMFDLLYQLIMFCFVSFFELLKKFHFF